MASQDNDQVNPEPEPGIFLTKGMRFGIDEFTIALNDDGSVETSPVLLRTRIEMCPIWLSLAFDHLLTAEVASNNIPEAKRAKDDVAVGKALQDEFLAGMQTTLCACIAMDSYYAGVKKHVQIPESTLAAWRDKGTARPTQIAETLRRAFGLDPAATKKLKQVLNASYMLRDKAVHPAADEARPMFHPVLNQMTDWRYAVFRFENGFNIVKSMLNIIHQTSTKIPSRRTKELKDYGSWLSAQVQPTKTKWEQHFREEL